MAEVVRCAAAVWAGALVLLVLGPSALWLPLLVCTTAGLVAWTAIEDALHRFVLHGLAPFRAGMCSTTGQACRWPVVS